MLDDVPKQTENFGTTLFNKPMWYDICTITERLDVCGLSHIYAEDTDSLRYFWWCVFSPVSVFINLPMGWYEITHLHALGDSNRDFFTQSYRCTSFIFCVQISVIRSISSSIAQFLSPFFIFAFSRYTFFDKKWYFFEKGLAFWENLSYDIEGPGR